MFTLHRCVRSVPSWRRSWSHRKWVWSGKRIFLPLPKHSFASFLILIIPSVGTDWDVVRKCVCAAYFHQVRFSVLSPWICFHWTFSPLGGSSQRHWGVCKCKERYAGQSSSNQVGGQNIGKIEMETWTSIPTVLSLAWALLLTMWFITSSSWPQRYFNFHPTTEDWPIYPFQLMTVKEYMHTATAVDGYWLAELGPMFFSVKVQPCADEYSFVF